MRILAIISLFLFAMQAQAQVIPVSVEQRDGKWTLIRDGQPYFINGGGGQTYMDKLVDIGGNSIRTWGTENAQEILDEAHSKGLTVMLGLWVQHERHGFNYDDTIAIRKQLEGFRKEVMRYKDHPALLLWGVGNEVDLNYSNTKVWDAVQDIAKMIHELDPNHPTSAVTAGLDKNEVELILEKAPDIDIYGVNTYGDIGNVHKNIRSFGWNGPYMITEWGVNGHCECPKTDFGVPIEQNSHQKAVSFFERYAFISDDSDYCIGSFAFLWGFKQETTSTWYGLFTSNGSSGEAVDALQRRWGSEPSNRAPQLFSLKINNKAPAESVYLTASMMSEATVDVTDPDGDKLKYSWSIVPESTDIKSGGDAESAPDAISGSIKKFKDGKLEFRVPKIEGPYRLFLFVYDEKGHAGTANFPFYVLPRSKDEEQARGIEFKKRELDIPPQY